MHQFKNLSSHCSKTLLKILSPDRDTISRNWDTLRNKQLSAACILIAVSTLLPITTNSAPKDPNIGESFLGNANAKVVLVEYGSLVCGHCADLATDVMPEIKKKYVDTGKVKFVFRPMPTQPASLSIGLQVIADCAGGQKRYQIIDEFYRNQGIIFQRANSANGALKYALQLANKSAGLDENRAKTCLQDSAMIAKVQDIADWGDRTYKISGTPTLLINGKDIDPMNTNQFTVQFISSQIEKALNTKPAKGKTK